ncbi:hypothetical protein HHO41_04850 [Bacillus sp. DNRA2]|uniref:hypothetical protein n=1 Tax=Bacillus sp. DNRA2 TaxID=2723053 RepID=UPI00145F7322|nr:hypothetical protein [Bacillus sp. DNRA2]NMD69609.1 hypothetical protein [Bacillus sp. DNRA2]
MNVQITVRKTVYQKSNFRAAGTGFSSEIKKEGYDSFFTGLHRNGLLTDEIDNAMKRLIGSLVGNEDTDANVTIILPEGYALTETLKQHYIDKLTVEPEINSVVFA